MVDPIHARLALRIDVDDASHHGDTLAQGAGAGHGELAALGGEDLRDQVLGVGSRVLEDVHRLELRESLDEGRGLDVADDVVPVAELERGVLERLDLDEDMRDVQVLDRRDAIRAVEQQEPVAPRKLRDDGRVAEDSVGRETIEQPRDALVVDLLVEEEVGDRNDAEVGKPSGRPLAQGSSQPERWTSSPFSALLRWIEFNPW